MCNPRRGPGRPPPNLPQERIAPAKPALEGWPVWHAASLSIVLGLALAASVGLGLALAAPAVADEAADIVRDADRFRRPADSFVWKINITSEEAKKAPTVDGFEVYVDRARVPALVAALERRDVPSIDHDAAEAIRVESGVPAFHRDMD